MAPGVGSLRAHAPKWTSLDPANMYARTLGRSVAAPGAPALAPKPSRRRWVLAIVAVVVVALVAVLAGVYVPVHSLSTEVQVTSLSGASSTIPLPASVWVTVHVYHHGSMPMSYHMDGPEGGMMYDRQGMMDGDSYAFWSNGGSYSCWAGYSSGWGGATPVWFNATWGML